VTADAVGPYELEPAHFRPQAEKLAQLLEAVDEADVVLGAYDRRVIQWLSDWETGTVDVVAGLVARAHAAGYATGYSHGVIDS
jgi:hypothetical protein